LSEPDAGAAVRTPWGNTAELRDRKLHPSAGKPRSKVIANQRARLFAAIVAVVSEKGYEATTVADVVKLSGVSRSAFYEHFANKGDCLAAAAAELIEPTFAEMRDFEHRRDALGRLLELLDDQPAAARAWFIELPAVGPVGQAVVERGMMALSELLAGSDRGRDPDLSRALVAGVYKLIQTRLCRGEEGAAAIAADLWTWLASVEDPPAPLAVRKGRSGSGPRFQGYTPAERIARAVASVVAERGYLEMSTDDIAARAAISLSTFYAHFADKHDAVLAALEMSGAQLLALAGPAARRAGDWQHGARALYEAICAYFAAEPEMAGLATVGIYGAGPKALARRDRVIDSLAAMLAPGFEENPGAPSLSADAAAATGYALIARQVRARGAESLAEVVPLATYVTLVGFVGPERACAVANDGPPGR
jgi:AcrR family transcriptional regulator